MERWAGLALVLLLVGVLLLAWAIRSRRASGVPAGRIAYGDTGAWRANSRTLQSSTHRLAGRPDYLVQSRSGLIPVELKSGSKPSRPHDGHRLQLAAYCLLVEETFGARPPYGIIQYRDGGLRVANDERLRTELLATLGAMRGCLQAHRAQDGYRGTARCVRCSQRENCGVK